MKHKYSFLIDQKPKTPTINARRNISCFASVQELEPTIGHLKTDYRLGRNFYKGLFGDAINVMLVAATYNFKRAMKVLWLLLKKSFKHYLQIIFYTNMLFKDRLIILYLFLGILWS
jgi:hypothetical protein